MNKTIKSIVFAVVAVILIAAIAGISVLISRVITKPEDNVDIKTEPDPSDVPDEVLIFDYESESYLKISALTMPIADTGAEQTVLLSAKVLPDDAPDKSLDWSIDWQNPSSEWATGKILSDYAKLISSEDGGNSANFSVLKAFGEPIVITVSSRVNPQVKATCVVNYVKRISLDSIEFAYPNDLHTDLWGNATVSSNVAQIQYADVIVGTVATTGTIEPTSTTITVTLDDSAFYTKMRELLRAAVDSAGTVSPEFSLFSRFKQCPNYSKTFEVKPGESCRAEYVPMFGQSKMELSGNVVTNDFNYGYVSHASEYYAQEFFYRNYFKESYRFYQGDSESAALRNALSKILLANMDAFDKLDIQLTISINSTYGNKTYNPYINKMNFALNDAHCKYRLTDLLKMIARLSVSAIEMQSNIYV